MNIPHDDDINRRQQTFPIIANPHHSGKQEKPRNRFGNAHLFKPSDDLLLGVFREKVI